MELQVDPERLDIPETGIFVRAKLNDKWGSHDIAHLKPESLLVWLRSRGGENVWAENVVFLLLGHEPYKDG